MSVASTSRPAELAAPRPIGGHAAIGDARSCALTDGRGGIAWLAWPRFDSEPIFSGILDPGGGTFDVRPASAHRATSRYVAETNVALTVFEATAGTVELADFMTVERDGSPAPRLAPGSSCIS